MADEWGKIVVGGGVRDWMFVQPNRRDYSHYVTLNVDSSWASPQEDKRGTMT
jgi:hypothetical protein